MGLNVKLNVYLGFAYFTKTENFLLKVLYTKIKVSLNNLVGHMNNAKNYSRTYE